MIFATVLISALPFIAVNFPRDQLPAQFEVQRFGSARSIVAADRAYMELMVFLREEHSGWHKDYASYAPHLVFKSKDISINCIGTLIVVNYRTRDGGMEQIAKTAKRHCPGDEASVQ
jgi:hypothetical protein